MSAMPKWTPGPWEYVPKLSASENHKGFFIRAEKAMRNGKWALADVQPGDEDGALGAANARLIAAAPDLLSACKQALSANQLSASYDADLSATLIDAIFKATGEQ